MGDEASNRIPILQSGKTRFRTLFVTGAIWTMLGFGLQQIIRLVPQVYITNQLFPEDVGLFVLINVWLRGFQLFTDLGLRPSIIQDERGGEPLFLQTAWTFQILRGIIIFAFICLSGFVLAPVYGEQAILTLMPVAGLEALLVGGATTATFLANRRLQMGRVTILDLASSFIGSVVAMAWAYVSPTIWAFLALPVSAALARLVLSHIMFPQPRMKLAMEPAARSAILNFGKWIFLSSMLGFFAGNMDRLVLPKLMPLDVFGIYGIAYMWARTVVNALQTVGAKVLLPTYAYLSEGDRPDLARKVLQIRLALLAPSLTVIFGFVLFGQQFIMLLYKDEYSDGGWVLQAIAAGAAISAVLATSIPVLLAVGDSYRFMLVLFVGMITKAACMAVGHLAAGTTGVIIGVAAADLFVYPFVARFTHRYGVWQPVLDFAVFALTAAVAIVAYRIG